MLELIIIYEARIVLAIKYGNYASSSTDKENNLKLELKSLEEEISELSNKIEEIDIRLDSLRYKEREILIAYYVDGCTYEDIGNRVYWNLFKQTRSMRHIQRMIERSTNKILKLG